MTTSLSAFTPQQTRAINSNFTKSGPFLLSDDIHSMLDCACTWDVQLNSVDHSPMLGTTPLALAAPGVLRGEFFGGIYFDRSTHRQAMVDRPGFDILRAIATGTNSYAALTEHDGLPSGSALDDALRHLTSAGVVQVSSDRPDVRLIPARDVSIAYLQSPTIVEAELTYGCFRACRHCAYSSSPQARTDDELTCDQWERIFEKLAAAGVLVIQLTGGDPLFRPDAFDILDAADRMGLSVYVRSDTVALTDDNLERLQGLRNLWHIGTSIDGADAPMHDWMRGKGAFATLVERIEKLASRGVGVAAGATLHRNNYQSVQEIGRVATEHGANWFDIGFLSPVGRGVDLAHLVLDAPEVRAALDAYLAGVESGAYQPSHGHYLRRAGSPDAFGDLGDLVDVLPYITEWPWSRLRIDPRGSTYTAGKLKGSDYSGGYNLIDSTVEYVWDNSPNLVQLREFGGGRVHGLDYRLLRSDHQFS